MNDSEKERLIRHTIRQLRDAGWDPPERVAQKNEALDLGIEVLVHIANTGSISKEVRETVVEKMWKARQSPLVIPMDGTYQIEGRIE